MNRQVITTINGIEITAILDKNHDIFVPVKPICNALEIDHAAQVQRIKRHYILSSTMVILTTVAEDEKEREMLCLPLKFAYGWIFTIDANLVAESRRESVGAYQLECYEALYRHFAGSLRRRVEENEAEISALQAVNDAISREKEARNDRRKAEEHLAAIRKNRLDSSPVLDFD